MLSKYVSKSELSERNVRTYTSTSDRHPSLNERHKAVDDNVNRIQISRQGIEHDLARADWLDNMNRIQISRRQIKHGLASDWLNIRESNQFKYRN